MSKTESKQNLNGKTIAILATNGVEQIELTDPQQAIKKAGGEVHVIAPEMGEIQGMRHNAMGDKLTVDKPIDAASAENYDGLMLPGGVANPDTLRTNDACVDFVRDFFKQGKPVAAICHGPWMLVEADVVKDRKVTSWPSLKTDLKNAGANWVDEECVCDAGLVTSRKPDDLPAFCAKMVEEFAEGVHAEQTA